MRQELSSPMPRLTVLVLCWLVTVCPAAAAENAGTRSVFAFGAGNRALGLGGAFVAVADDASAALWNPAGLAAVERAGLQASTASVGALDLQEHFGAVVWPSTRFGVPAVSIRRLGVGGIDLRDDRNALIDDGQSAQDAEVLVGWGRHLGAQWMIGAGVKVRRQSIAGTEGSGLGLDLGLVGSPATLFGGRGALARRLRWGLALRNAVEPTIRLVADEVPDPMTVQSGLAYTHPAFGRGHILLTVDVEKARLSDADWHMGAELTMHPALSVRAGSNAGTFAAGAAVHWRSLTADFVHESGEFQSTRRIGLSMDFGATVSERLLEAAARQEAEFNERMEASFRAEQESRVATLVDEAEQALAAGDLEQVLRAAATVQAIEPGHPRGVALEVEALRAQAQKLERQGDYAGAAVLCGRALALTPDERNLQIEHDRLRQESDRRAQRDAQRKSDFAAALDAFAAGQFVRAKGYLQSVLNDSPADTEAAVMLERVESAIDTRRREALTQARRFADRGLRGDAEDALQSARALGATGVTLARAERYVASALQEATVSQEPARGPVRPLSKETPGASYALLDAARQAEVRDLYERGIASMEADRPADAMRYWELVWATAPDYQNVAEYIKRDYLLRGLESFSLGELDAAVGLWERALQVDPDDEKTQSYLASAREQLARSQELVGPYAE